MFILEYRVFQGTEKCPQYLWKQMLMCKSKDTLELIRSKQLHPENWRVCPTAEDEATILKG